MPSGFPRELRFNARLGTLSHVQSLRWVVQQIVDGPGKGLGAVANQGVPCAGRLRGAKAWGEKRNFVAMASSTLFWSPVPMRSGHKWSRLDILRLCRPPSRSRSLGRLPIRLGLGSAPEDDVHIWVRNQGQNVHFKVAASTLGGYDILREQNDFGTVSPISPGLLAKTPRSTPLGINGCGLVLDVESGVGRRK